MNWCGILYENLSNISSVHIIKNLKNVCCKHIICKNNEKSRSVLLFNSQNKFNKVFIREVSKGKFQTCHISKYIVTQAFLIGCYQSVKNSEMLFQPRVRNECGHDLQRDCRQCRKAAAMVDAVLHIAQCILYEIGGGLCRKIIYKISA